MEQKNTATSDREIIISRLINAPQQMVFDVWTDPNHVEKWWGPNGFSTTSHEMEVRPGGKWRLTMNGMGMTFPNVIEYIEVVRPERLVYHHGTDEPNDPNRFHVTVTFEPKGDKTLLTMHSIFPTVAFRDMVVNEFKAIEGGEQNMDRFVLQLAALHPRQDLALTRTLNAPRQMVFDAWTDPEQLAKWWGPRGFSAPTCELDAKAGGNIRINMHAPQLGFPNHWMTGTMQEVIAPERLVFTSRAFENEYGKPGIENLNTITFREVGDKTEIVISVQILSAAPEMAQAVAGMETGWSQSIDRLGEVLATGKVVS
jgi:uncharacterized protein YndB with AHSA1/START domain